MALALMWVAASPAAAVCRTLEGLGVASAPWPAQGSGSSKRGMWRAGHVAGAAAGLIALQSPAVCAAQG